MPNAALDELNNYILKFPEERSCLLHLNEQISDKYIYSRSNMTGHITSSGLVISPDKTKVLLIHHKIYDKWIAPGGHIDDPKQSLFDSACRELLEETGLIISNLTTQTLLDIDSHHIAPNIKKNEGAHWHHDFLYLIQAKNINDLIPELNEVNGAEWVGIEKLRSFTDPRYKKISTKLDDILNRDIIMDLPSNIAFELGRVLHAYEQKNHFRGKVKNADLELSSIQTHTTLNGIFEDCNNFYDDQQSRAESRKETILSAYISLAKHAKKLSHSFCDNYPEYEHVLNKKLNKSLKLDIKNEGILNILDTDFLQP